MSNLSGIQVLASTVSPVYTNPLDTTTEILSIVLHNYSTISVVVEVYNVLSVSEAAGSPSNTGPTANMFLNLLLAPNETLSYDFRYPLTLPSLNDTIQAKCSDANSVTLMLLGRTL